MPKKPSDPCASCGQLLWSGRGSLPAGQRRCRQCRAGGVEPGVRTKTCAVCGHAFAAVAANASLCSDACRSVKYHGRLPANIVQGGLCTCSNTLPKGLRRRRCDACLKRTEQEKGRERNRRRRARKCNAPRERYTLAEIAARDRYRCGICRAVVRMSDTYPHLMSPSIDHILPLAHGGHDVRANVQLAHFICNSLKSDGGAPQQLLLFG